MSRRSTLTRLAPAWPTEATSSSNSEGEPGADPPAWVFERSLEGESEIPRVSEGRDAEANARWSSTGLTRAHHHAGAGFGGGRCLVAGLFRRRLLWQFRCHRSGEKLQRSSSTRRPLRLRGRSAECFGFGCGRCLVAGLFRRRLLWQFRCHRSGEKLQRSSSTRRPLSLRGRSARSFGISRPLALRSPLLPGCRPAHVGCRGRRLLRYRSPSPR